MISRLNVITSTWVSGGAIGLVLSGCLLSCQGSSSRGLHLGAASEPPPEAAPPLEPFTQDIAGSAVTFEMKPVPAGEVTFQVGEETYTEQVGPLWVAKTETTWEMYDIFVFQLDKDNTNEAADAVTRPSKPYVSPDRGFGHNGYAAISLSYKGADSFCKWLSAKTGKHYRLPTEAEWRYICEQAKVDASKLDEHAWSEENADFTPHPVGQKKADALGLFDLYGNVREWAQGADGKPVALGGSFQDAIDKLGPAGRELYDRDWQMTDPQIPKSPWWLSDGPFMGCRVICVPDDAKKDNDQ